MPQVRVEERSERRDGGYRAAAEETVLEVERPPLPRLPGVGVGPVFAAVVGLSSVVGLAFVPLIQLSAQGPGAQWAGPILYGLAIMAIVVSVIEMASELPRLRLGRQRAARRPRETLRIRVDPTGLRADPVAKRAPWDGCASPSQVQRIRVVEGDRYHDLRLELVDGRDLPLLEGIEDLDEAIALAERMIRHIPDLRE